MVSLTKVGLILEFFCILPGFFVTLPNDAAMRESIDKQIILIYSECIYER